jgi:hypothetical protein
MTTIDLVSYWRYSTFGENMEKRIVKYHPHPDYRYWLYDPEGDGMTYYRTQEDRDNAGKQAVEMYLSDGEWDDQVERVTAGMVTHYAQLINKEQQPDNLENEGCDDWIGDYALKSIAPKPEGE